MFVFLQCGKITLLICVCLNFVEMIQSVYKVEKRKHYWLELLPDTLSPELFRAASTINNAATNNDKHPKIAALSKRFSGIESSEANSKAPRTIKINKPIKDNKI